jgi:hypothetical protein
MNAYYGRQPAWNSGSATATPAGPPIWSGAPSARAVNGDGDVQLNWASPDANGSSITSITAVAYRGPRPTCSPDGTVSVVSGQTSGPLGAGATSAQFSGLQAGVQWTFAVFARNGVDCTGSATTTAEPLSPPTAPTRVQIDKPDPDAPIGGTDRYLPHFRGAVSDQTGSGGTQWYQYCTSQCAGAGSNAGATDVSPGDAIPGAFGQPLQVRVRSVVDYGNGLVLRSDWSAAVDAGVPVDAGTATVTHIPDGTQPGNTVFTWTNAPAGAGYTAVQYRCGSSGAFTAMQPAGSCSANGTGRAAAMTVRVTANGATYDKIYLGDQ